MRFVMEGSTAPSASCLRGGCESETSACAGGSNGSSVEIHVLKIFFGILHFCQDLLGNLTSPHPTSPYLTLPYFTSPHLPSSRLTLPHLFSPHLPSPYLT